MSKAIVAVVVLAMLVLGGCSGGDAPARSASDGARDRAAAQSGTTTTAPTTESTKAEGKGAAKASSGPSEGSGKAGASPAGSQASGSAGKSKPSTGAKATGKRPAPSGSSAGTKSGAKSVAKSGGQKGQGASTGAAGSNGAQGSSGDDSAEAAPALTITSKAEAAARYQEIDDAYTASLRDLLKALVKTPVNMKAVRAGVVKSTTGYEGRLDSLRAVNWPSAVQPKVDTFVDLASTTGHRMFKQMEKAKSPADLTGRADQADVRKLRNAEKGMRSALGLPNPTDG